MPDTKISALTSGNPPQDADEFPIRRTTGNNKLSWLNLRTALASLFAGSGAVGSSGITMSTARLLGRSTAGTGPVEEITLGTNLSLSGTTLNATGGLPTGLSYSSNTLLQQNGSAAQTYTLERAGDGGANRGYTNLRQDATSGFIVDSVHTGTVAAPANIIDVRGNGTSRFTLSAAGNGVLGNYGAFLQLGGIVGINYNATNQVNLQGDAVVTWSAGSIASAPDLAIGRLSAGVGAVTNGTAGQYRDWRARNLIASGTSRVIPVPVGSLPSASASGAGAEATVNDALAPAWGATVAGGGAITVGVRSDGTNWIVF